MVTQARAVPDVADVAVAICTVRDPEIPVISIDDLGIVRDIDVDEEAATVQVVITPTYSGCPAMQQITDHIAHAAATEGYAATVETRLSPAWTTDWMSDVGRERLREFGIAPPGEVRHTGTVTLGGLSVRQVSCPLCGSPDTEEVARFGSTACKALRRCRGCAEPFDEFKAI